MYYSKKLKRSINLTLACFFLISHDQVELIESLVFEKNEAESVLFRIQNLKTQMKNHEMCLKPQSFL